MSFLISVIVFVAGVLVGAFSHKYLARESAKAQSAVSTAVTNEIKKV